MRLVKPKRIAVAAAAALIAAAIAAAVAAGPAGAAGHASTWGIGPGVASALPDGWSLPDLTDAQYAEVAAAIDAMKREPRGPYERIRWFCNDGTVLPPGPGACRPHGGGTQHAEYTPETIRYGTWGFHFGPILAATDYETFLDPDNSYYFLRELALQAYLESYDDGWVMRRARFYRGARQAENEEAIGRRYLETLLDDASWRAQEPLLSTLVVGAVPHGRPGLPEDQIRALAEEVSEAEPSFRDLRIKIHSTPGPEDLPAVRDFRARLAPGAPDELHTQLDELIAGLESRYESVLDESRWSSLSDRLAGLSIAVDIGHTPQQLGRLAPAERISWLAGLARRARATLEGDVNGSRALVLLDTILEIRGLLYAEANALAGALEADGDWTRRQLLASISDMVDAAYGVGWLNGREHRELQSRLVPFLHTTSRNPTPAEYGAMIDYLVRSVEWGSAAFEYVMALPLARYERVEPASIGFRDDAVRGSLLLPLGRLLELLTVDAAVVSGMRHVLFDESSVASGLIGLNPGIAIGPLRMVTRDELDDLDPDSIYVLPDTPADLGRVAGILTLGRGSRLSHVQLLARGLGIPNAAIATRHVAGLQEHIGETVIYAVSPSGAVALQRLDALPAQLARRLSEPDLLAVEDLEIDTTELDLTVRSVLPLESIDASDSGRIAGPKAANLGQLHRFFPDRVAPGLVIPFGAFRWHVDRDLDGDGRTLYEEIVDVYAVDPGRPDLVLERLARVRRKIQTMELIPEFEADLTAALVERFDGGVFVRSDTNVEDLPGFSGAGLNLTKMNVIGVQGVLDAVREVWASPFTERSYVWRQQVVTTPAAVYPSILILGSVPAEASGVLVTMDIDGVLSKVADDPPDGWTVTLAAGVGGAVDGEHTETTLMPAQAGTFEPLLLSSARAPWRKALNGGGGMVDTPVVGEKVLLTPARAADLRTVVDEIIRRYPPSLTASGEAMPWDIEFGFIGDRTMLFQIRPFVTLRTGSRLAALQELVGTPAPTTAGRVALDEPPVRQ